MQSIEELGRVISTDVLILGGGIAGLCAAVKAKESPVDVMVVDKGGIGWAGQAPIGGGMVMHIDPERADVISAGTMIMYKIMETENFDTITVSDRGLRFGIALRTFQSDSVSAR